MEINSNNEISLKELVGLIIDWKNYFLSKWKLLLILGIFGAAAGFIYSKYKKPIYNAELTFALEEKNSGGIGGYASIASQFGIDIGGGNNGAFSGENLLELMKSRLLIEKSLLTPIDYKNKKEYLLNIYIRSEELDEGWSKSPELANMNFNFPIQIDSLSLKQDSIIGAVVGKIRKENLSVSKLDKKLNIVSVKCDSKSEVFSKIFTEVLVQNVTGFYIETKTKKSRANVDNLQRRTDSVRRELDGEMYSAAQTQDQNLNIIRARAKVTGARKQMNVQMLGTMYGELVKNLEFSKLALMREEPLIQIIDSPILPLPKERLGKLKGMVLGGIIFGFLGLIYLMILRLKKTLI